MLKTEKVLELDDALAFVWNAIEKEHGLVLLSAYRADNGIQVDGHLRAIPGDHALLLASDLWNMIAADSSVQFLKLLGKAMDAAARRVAEVGQGEDTTDLRGLH